MAARQQQQQDPAPEPAYVDEDHQRIHEFAQDYFEDEDERDEFVNTLMERHGYQRVSSWGPRTEQPDPDPEPDPPQRQRGGGRQGASPAPRQRSRASYFKH